jgi:TetR/AcrR family transcriptional regulator, repressor for neighboring sulfatase
VRGRDQVTAALLDAAAALLAARGPAAVSVRDIAAHAGVNHGLVHRHFGSKQALLGAVLDGLAHGISLTGGDDETGRAGLLHLFDAAAGNDLYFRVLARSILDGEAPQELQSDFPIMHYLVETFRDLQRDGQFAPELDARLLAAGSAALALGWTLFAPFVAVAAGFPSSDAEHLRSAIRQGMLALFRRLHGPAPDA